jgi:hypothetical protein
MQCQLMSSVMDLFDQALMLFGMFSHQMKCSAHIVFLQHIEQARRIAQMRSIVEGQGDGAIRSSAIEQDVGIAVLCSSIQMMKGGCNKVHQVPIKSQTHSMLLGGFVMGGQKLI